MAGKAQLRNTSNVRFLSSQTWIWAGLRRYCESNWETYCAERRSGHPGPVRDSTPETVAAWCERFGKRNGRKLPAIVGAAATFRSDFVRLVAVAMPDTGIDLPDYPDLVNKAIADSPNWTSAVQIALDDVRRVTEVLRRARPRWRITTDSDPKDILDHVEKEYECRLRNIFKRTKTQLSILRLKPLTEHGYIIVPVSPDNELIVEAFASGEMHPTTVEITSSPGSEQSFGLAHTLLKSQGKSDKAQTTRLIGFRQPPEEYLWKLLERNGALAIKAHYALWARWAQEYPKMDFTPAHTLSLTISQFCDDLGFEQHKGDHRVKNKRTAVALLELLTSIEFLCLHQHDNSSIEITGGPIWRRAGLPEELHGFENVWSKSNHGLQNMWVHNAFSYAPGIMFASEAWRKQNRFNARLGAAFLELQTENRDKYALIVGGYLASLIRADESVPIKISMQTLAEKTGMWSVDGRNDSFQLENKIVRALGKLIEKEVIKSYKIRPLGKGESNNTKRTLERVCVIDWPDAHQTEAHNDSLEEKGKSKAKRLERN